MANEQNLIPQNKRSQRERKEIASMGAKAANEKRRQRKQLKECMEIVLNLPPDSKTTNQLLRMGIDPTDLDNAQAVTVALFRKAMTGDVMAFKELRSLVAEDSADNGQLGALIEGLKNADI